MLLKLPNMLIIRFLKLFLFPIALLYGIIIRIRHFLYDIGIFSSKQYETPLISIGNIRVGGTGKTPMTQYLIELLKNKYAIGVVSRGYGRHSKGLVIADSQSNALSLGDEPYQYYRRYAPEVRIAVCSHRQQAIEALKEKYPEIEVFLLDDAFQHRKIRPKFSILLTAYSDLYSDDFLLPLGWLRDVKSRAVVADVIIVSKCPPEISENQKEQIIKKLNLTCNQKVFFSYIRYARQIYTQLGETIDLQQWIKEPFTLVTGIANPKPMIAYLKERGGIFQTRIFADHHHFSSEEIQQLKKEKRLLTTEKDFVRLMPEIPFVYFLPIEMDFVTEAQKQEFNQIILSQIH